MPLFFDSFRTGLGLWQFPWPAFFFELSLLVLAGYYLLKGSNRIKRHLILIVFLTAGFTAMFLAPVAEATPAQASIVSLSLYTALAALAYWAERERK